MAVRSRSSLRFSVRRDQDTSDDALPPPPKRPRLQHQYGNRHHSQNKIHASRRRKSSPDLLDTTVENSSNPPSNKPQLVRHANSSIPIPPRPLPLTSAASSSSSRLPPPGTPRTTGTLNHRHDTPSSASAALFLRGGRESPDPLDTISPAPATKTVSGTSPTRTPTRSTRRHPSRPLLPVAVDTHAEKDPTGSNNTDLVHNASRSSRRITTSHNPTSSQPTPVPSNSSPAVPEQRRSLRSKDVGSRARSELALYFQNYEELISLEPPKTSELLTGNTAIKLIDDLTEPPMSLSNLPVCNSEAPFGNPLLQLNGCETISLPEPETEPDVKPVAENGDVQEEDPLDEGVFFRAHRRMERQEKQLRNIERERAQHEKLQLDRLLDELKSQDWLRVMGISGVTDQEKKLYELKRDYFVKEISSLIEKFKIWKEEEKRRKLEKDKSFLRLDAQAPEALKERDHTPQQERRKADDEESNAEDLTANGVVLSDAQSLGQPPDINDVDAWAALQLHQEALSATAGKRPKPSTEGRRKSSKPAAQEPPPRPQTPPPPDRPFTSFYSKPHLRDVALSPHRKGRTRFAFGHPIPDMEEREFQPPPDILTAEAIDACRRKRRRMKRQSSKVRN